MSLDISPCLLDVNLLSVQPIFLRCCIPRPAGTFASDSVHRQTARTSSLSHRIQVHIRYVTGKIGALLLVRLFLNRPSQP